MISLLCHDFIIHNWIFNLLNHGGMQMLKNKDAYVFSPLSLTPPPEKVFSNQLSLCLSEARHREGVRGKGPRSCKQD